MDVYREIPVVGGLAATPDVDPLAAWRNELAGLDPRSHDYIGLASALAELSGEEVVPPPNDEPSAPPGFTQAVALGSLIVPTGQFRHKIEPLLSAGTELEVSSVVELATDRGKRVRLADLRPNLRHQLHDIEPDAACAPHLDSHFYNDLRLYADRGWARNTVHGLHGVLYTRVMSSKTRAIWGPVRVVERDGEHVLTVARFGDCGNDPHKQVALYRRLFGMTLRNVA